MSYRLARILLSASLAAVFATAATGCSKSTPSAKSESPRISDSTHKTLLAFQRLESLTESGITRSEYMKELAELNVVIKQHGTGQQDGNTELTKELDKASEWYNTAAELWSEADFLRCDQQRYLCMQYPEILDKKDDKGDPIQFRTNDVVTDTWEKASKSLQRAMQHAGQRVS